MKKKLCFKSLLTGAFLFLFGTASAFGQVTVTLGDATVSPGTSDFTVDVSVNDQAPAIKGVEINIGYDSSVLTFKSGTAVDGNWMVSNIATVAVDETNTQSGQLKILLAAVSTGIAANTASTLARLTFDIASTADQLSYTLGHLSSSPGLKDTSNASISYTAGDGTVSVAGIPTGTITLSADPTSVPADGASATTISSSAIKDAASQNVPDGTKITVATDLGTITTTDADGSTGGIQVLTSSGGITFTLQSATTMGTATVTAGSVSGDATGNTTVSFTAGAVSAANSTVDVDKASTQVGTGGSDGIAVTVTLKDANEHLIEGTEVFLSVTGSGNYVNGTTEGNGPTSIGVTNASGVASGVIKSTKAEGKTISAKGGSTNIADTEAVTYTPSDATSLTVAGITDLVTAGTASDVVVTAQDEYGNVATGYTGIVAFTSTDGEAVVPDNYTFQAGDSGTKTFSSAVTLKTAGEQTVTATDTVTGTITGSQTEVTVSPAAASTLTVTGITDPVTAGTASDVVVTAYDEYNNVATGYTGTVTFTSTDGEAVVPDNYTFQAGDSGTKTFSSAVTLKTAGEQTVTATDTVTGTITGSQTEITIHPAAASTLTVTGITDPVTAGTASDVVVTAYDEYNNVATGYTGTVTFTSTDGEAVVPDNYTFQAGDSGTKTFSSAMTLKTAGEQTVTATDTVTGTITGSQAEITIHSAAASKMCLEASKTTLASDQKGSATLTATLLDDFNNVVSTDNSTVVNFALTDATYLTLGSPSATASSGVATVTVTTKAGQVTDTPATSGVNITSGELSAPSADPDVTLTIFNYFIDVTGNQTSLVRSPLTPNTVVLTGQGGTSGNYRWTLTGVGSFSSSGIVTESSEDSVTFYAPSAITGDSQTATVTVTDASDSELTDEVTLTVFNPTKLAITSTALNQEAGVSGTVTVQVQTDAETAVSAGAFTIDLSSDSTGTNHFYATGTTTGITQVSIADGASSATFDYYDEKAGTPTINASTDGLTAATQQETITHAEANKVTLEASKTTLASNQKGSAVLTATLLDQFNNVISTDNSTVVNFALTDATYLTLSSPNATASSGVATVTVTTKAGGVTDPPATSGVNITSGTLTLPSADPDVTLTIISHFSIRVDSPAAPFYDVSSGVYLVTSGSTPSTATFSGVGSDSGDYRWALDNQGSIDSTTADTITYTAPESLEGSSVTDTLTLSSASDSNLADTIEITTYNPIDIIWPISVAGIPFDDDAKSVVPFGGTGTYAFQSTDTGVAMVDAATGAITPVAAGTFTVQARDNTFGVFGTENGFNAITPTIEIINPIVIGSKPTNDALESDAENTFTAAGGKTEGLVNWEASAGTIDANGTFTAPTVTSGSLTVTITAYDKTYNKNHYTPVKTEYTITVFAPMDIIQKPEGYVDGQPSTYPLLTLGKTTILTASDADRYYDWVVTDWEGNQIVAETSGTAMFGLDPDVLFAAAGAGIYTVSITDQNNAGFEAGTLKVRVPMGFVAEKFAEAQVKDAGTYNDTQETDTFSVTGGPYGNVYNYAAFDLEGYEVVAENCGTFADTSPTDETNVFNFTYGIPDVIAFRVKVTLDSTSQDADVQRLIDAGLDELLSGIFRVVPVVTFSGMVVEIDESTPIVGATVCATHDATKTDTTAEDGTFSISGFHKTGASYKFAVSKSGYVDKVVTGDEILAGDIILESAGVDSGTISGAITLSDDPAPYRSGTVSIQVKASGQYLQDSSGNTVTVYANPVDGTYTFPVAADYAADGPFTLEFRKSGYIFGEFDDTTTQGLLTGVVLNAEDADITLKPVTIISASGTPVDSDEDGTNDQVLVKITAEAGATPERFDGTVGEIKVLDSDGNDLVGSLDVFGSEGDNTWSFTHDAYENFSITVYADVAEDRDVEAGYRATKTWNYVKSASAPAEKDIADPSITGGTAASNSGDTDVILPPGGLTGDIRNTVTFVIVEVDATESGATQITGSEIVEVDLIEESGEECDNEDIQRVEITLTFDPTVVTPGSLEDGTYVIYHADSTEDLIAGNGTAVPSSQIIQPVDYVNNRVTFWVDNLSAFGIGLPPVVGSDEIENDGAPEEADDGGSQATFAAGTSSGGCFITTATHDGSSFPMILILVLMSGILGGCFIVTMLRSLKKDVLRRRI